MRTPIGMPRRTLVSLALTGIVLGLLGSACSPDPELSLKHAREHAAFLAEVSAKDVAEVRLGLPQGAGHLSALWKDGHDPSKDPEAAKDGLARARGKVQDLRIVKSTFFALTTLDGTVVRTDQEQDLMAGKNIFPAFEPLRGARDGKYVEAVGSLHEARGVEGKPDGQWVAAQPISLDDKVVGLYVTGWSWSLYTYRLETALKGHLYDLDKLDKPLFYVFVVAGKTAVGTRPSPQVNAEAIQQLDPNAKLDAAGTFGTIVEITGRKFGLAVQRVPELGPDVSVAVLRSET